MRRKRPAESWEKRWLSNQVDTYSDPVKEAVLRLFLLQGFFIRKRGLIPVQAVPGNTLPIVQ